MPSLVAIYRHPVKGLSPEALDRVELNAGAFFPGDRLYAIENGPSGFDPTAPAHKPKIKFLMLMRDEALARLRTRYDDAATTLSILFPDGAEITGDLSTTEGRARIEGALAEALPANVRGPLKILSAPGHRFTDTDGAHVSLVNLASIAALSQLAGVDLDARRFRANLVIDGLAPWGEFDLVGKRLRIGGATFRVTMRIDRCAATDVDPETGVRATRLVPIMESRLGHHDCGVFLEVESGGPIARGDSMSVLGPVEARETERAGLPF